VNLWVCPFDELWICEFVHLTSCESASLSVWRELWFGELGSSNWDLVSSDSATSHSIPFWLDRWIRLGHLTSMGEEFGQRAQRASVNCCSLFDHDWGPCGDFFAIQGEKLLLEAEPLDLSQSHLTILACKKLKHFGEFDCYVSNVENPCPLHSMRPYLATGSLYRHNNSILVVHI